MPVNRNVIRPRIGVRVFSPAMFQQGLQVMLLGAVLLSGVGCRSLALSPEQQLQAREDFIRTAIPS